MRYRPVRTLVDINELSQAKATEGRSLDFKGHVDGTQWWELGKDIAAFANHVGGTILVGAAELPNGSAKFAGIDPGVAGDLRTRYENAAKDRCRPRPIVVVESIALDATKTVLAVNVEPFPLGPVGAAFFTLNKNREPDTCDAWRFPVRIGKHNVPLQPDQIAMFMEPRIRRVVTLLEELVVAEAQNIGTGRSHIFMHTQSGAHGGGGTSINRVSIDVRQNALAFVFLGANLRAPLDDVEAVWAQDDVWHVRVSGLVQGEGVERHYLSRAARGF